MRIEETVLFPTAYELLTEKNWVDVRKGEEEIGWMFKDIPPILSISETSEIPKDESPSLNSFSKTDKFTLNEGYLSVEQINLMLKTLPIDITYVDENDKVIFYNRGEERVFPRSAGIIGREVQFCHPPKSVGTVLEILKKFKSGEQNESSFWLNYKNRLIHIRYFAIRDSDNVYKGVLEMSQDITDLKEIEGERRLLNWEK